MSEDEVVSEKELEDVGGMEIVIEEEETIIDIVDEDPLLEDDLLEKKSLSEDEDSDEDPLLESYMFHGHEEEMY